MVGGGELSAVLNTAPPSLLTQQLKQITIDDVLVKNVKTEDGKI